MIHKTSKFKYAVPAELGMFILNAKYIPEKDCSEYAEDVIASFPGELVTFVFADETGRLERFRVKGDRDPCRFPYLYHTVARVQSWYIDLTNESPVGLFEELGKNAMISNAMRKVKMHVFVGQVNITAGMELRNIRDNHKLLN